MFISITNNQHEKLIIFISIKRSILYQIMKYGEGPENTNYIKCLYCNEKDENKLLKNIFKNRIICKNCYDIIIDMTKPYRNK